MKIVKFLFLIFILLQTPIKVNSSENIKTSLEQGKKLIFIRHAYAPGSGDPSNFNIKNCATQRNLNQRGRYQAQKIKFFLKQVMYKLTMLLAVNGADAKKQHL